MQRYIGDIITDARYDTQNADDIPTSASAVGIETAGFLRYANWAQQRLQGLISRVYPVAFEAVKEISIVANQREYSIPDHVYLGTRIRKVEYSHSGEDKDYLPLPPTAPYNTYNQNTGRPCAYSRQDGTIILEGTPSSSTGSIRVTFERTLDKLALRVAQVNGTPSGTTIDLTHGTFGAPSAEVEALLTANTYLCICDAYGTPMAYNIVISSYTAGTDAVTTAANVDTYLLGSYTLANLADGYVTIGKYTTTHSKLCEDAERYLIEYINRRIATRENSSARVAIDPQLQEIEQEIVRSYKIADKDVKPIPIYDYSFFQVGYGWDD